ncbi:MAG: hypothetical protein MUO76_02095 [Anaerolineaceae bacterium]|nr:hypothetical protein [Anaerolineaceae bacterium]
MKPGTIYKNKISRLVKTQEKERGFNPSEYRGIYKNLKIELEKEIEKIREEWIRE